MKSLLDLLLKGLRCVALTLCMRITAFAQTFQSTTALSTNTPTLVLPGSLTLTSIVNQSATPGGVPTGTVSFIFDGSNSLGTAPLQKMPATQSFPKAPTYSVSSLGTNPTGFGFVAVDLLGTGQPVLVVGNNPYSSPATVSVLQNLGAGKFGGTGTLSSPLGTNPYYNYNLIDQVASGFFLNKTTKSALLHSQDEYDVVTISSSALVITTSFAGPDSSQPDTEQIAINDFDGDGYSDVGVLVLGDAPYYLPIAGIALNEGASAPGKFTPLAQAALPTQLPNGDQGTFCADAIATGKFNSAFNPQLAVLGHFGTGTCAPPTNGTPSYVVLYAVPTGFTPGSSLTPLMASNGSSLQAVGTDQTTLASADFNQDGMVDLLVGSGADKHVQIFNGNGDGTFTPSAAPNNTPAGPLALNINDFNGDSYPDVAMTLSGASGLAVLLNDGTGKLQPATQPYSAGVPFSVNSGDYISSGDFNSDGLPDLALLQQATPTTQVSIDVFLSSESAQASLATAPKTLPAGKHTLQASYPGDTNFLPSTSTELSEIVEQTVPPITWPTPPAMQYGTALSTTQLNATASVPGSFTYSPAAGTVLPVGRTTVTAGFAPTDSFDYSGATATQTITVNQAVPPITWPTPPAMQYGTALSATQLNATASIPGSFTYSPAAGTVLPVGRTTVTAVFTPTDSRDYSGATVTQMITVNQAVPPITWPTPPAMQYGTALSATQLNATSSIPGSFTYSPAAGTVLPVGRTTVTAVFTPTDSRDYSGATVTQMITVNQAVPPITWPTPPAMQYGTALSATQLNATSSIPGSFTYSPAAGTVLPVGRTTVTAVFTPTDSRDYSGATVTQMITVNQAVPPITWPTPPAMQYGTALSATQLNATSSIPGSFTYSPAAGTVLPVGRTTVTAVFTPTDSRDYSGATVTQMITVNQAVPPITWPTPPAMQYGTALSTTQLNATASVPGSFTYSPAAGTVLPVGRTTVTAVFTPTDSRDYSSATATQTITVIAAPATATATAPATAETATTESASLTVNPYPVPITATLTLGFTPAPPNTVSDPAVLFPNNSTTEVILIPANSAANQSIDFSTGSTAGTITLTIVLTAGGTDITPSTLAPLDISLPASPPVINSVTLTRSGQSMTVAIVGLSSTRDMTQAHFHFTPAAGQSLKTTDITLDLSSPFGAWYGSSTSDTYGTTFQYTQPFTLDSDASTVANVSVTLANSKGDSLPHTAQ